MPAQSPPRSERLLGAARLHRAPSPGRQARRRALIIGAKFLLPLVALALLTTMAIWPELDRTVSETRNQIKQMIGDISGATLVDAHYHGVDDRGRPYTVTAATATQAGSDLINLTKPKGDLTLENGTWLMLQSDDGSYQKVARSLDLSKNVFLYRDDGTTMRTQSATIDLKAGAAAGSVPVHAEGPFGVLDATGGFTLTDRGAEIQFAGPAHVVLSGATAK